MKILCTRPWDEWEKKAILDVVEDAQFLESGPGRKIEDLVNEADVLYGFPDIPMSVIARSKTLRLIHVQSTGVDRFAPALIDSPIILTNSRGVHAKPVAEHAVALMIALAYNFRGHTKVQEECLWKDPGIDRLEGKVAGLLGLGAIGEEIARKCKAFDMEVIGVRRDVSRPVPANVDRVYGMDEIARVMAESDCVLCSLPLTRETASSVRYEHFAAMKPTALFVNVGRGPVVDEDGLIRALREGKLRGAGLDVFETEPLPPDSPLWKMENVVITPHTGGKSPENRRRSLAILTENLGRLRDGKPLINVVDKALGY
ncbi:MAG TPA: D-2-hydroxyacid dehydrogenase [Firmicutes bacterium]|nr:D-2-hydroxyacid dehydrogenase [Candidatus Fermentithermobacillaceae bacterium]